MTQVIQNWFVVDAVPTTNIVANAIYFVKLPGKSSARQYRANSAGSAVVPFSSNPEDVVYIGENEPPASSVAPFWLRLTDSGTSLFINITPNAASATWLDPITMPTMPDFAGNGTANTMAHSDHWHDGVYVQNAAW